MTLEQLITRIRDVIGPVTPFQLDVCYAQHKGIMNRPPRRTFDVTIHYDGEYYEGDCAEDALAKFDAAVNVESVDADAAAARVGEIGGAA